MGDRSKPRLAITRQLQICHKLWLVIFVGLFCFPRYDCCTDKVFGSLALKHAPRAGRVAATSAQGYLARHVCGTEWFPIDLQKVCDFSGTFLVPVSAMFPSALLAH